MLKNLARDLDAVTVAYLMAVVNSLLAVLLAFGVPLTDRQDAAVVAFVNAAIVALAHVSHQVGTNQQQLKTAAADAPVVVVGPPPPGE